MKADKESGMGIVEITPLSGYEVDTEGLLDMYKVMGMKRVEISGVTIVTYWDKVLCSVVFFLYLRRSTINRLKLKV